MRILTRICLIVLLFALGTFAASAQDSPKEVTVWVLTFTGDAVIQAWDKVVADFEAANPDIHITVEQRGVDDHKNALRVSAGTDASPDIYFMWAGLGLGGEFVNLGISQPLDADYDSLGWNERFVPSALAATEYNDQQHGVPYTIHGMVVYYRKDLFEQAGITEEPTTYDELVADNDKLVAAGIQPFAWGGSVNWHVMRLLDNLVETYCGAETHDALTSMTVSWNDEPCATQAFNELARWNSAGYMGSNYMGIDNNDAEVGVYAGTTAMMLEGDWQVNGIVDQGEDLANYGVFPFPTGTDRLYFFAEMLYVTANRPNQEAAVKFLDYLSSTEVQQEQLGNFGAVSVNSQVTYPDDRRPLDAEWSDIFAAYSQVFQPGDQAFPLAVTTEYWRIQNGVLTGEIDPNDAAGQLQTFIDNYKAGQS